MQHHSFLCENLARFGTKKIKISEKNISFSDNYDGLNNLSGTVPIHR